MVYNSFCITIYAHSTLAVAVGHALVTVHGSDNNSKTLRSFCFDTCFMVLNLIIVVIYTLVVNVNAWQLVYID